MVAFTLSITISLFFVWGVFHWAYVRVSELETAVVYRANGAAFSRFLAPGHHWIIPFVERIGDTIPLTPGMVKGLCADVETGSGIPLTIDWSLSYKLNPSRIPLAARPKLARSLPHKSGRMVRNHVNNCVRHVVGAYTVAEVSRPGMLQRLEREIRQQAMARLSGLGFEVSRVMLGAIEMPPAVRASMAEAYGQEMRVEHEAQTLLRLHQVVSQFSAADMARLMELERIYKLGENGVTMVYTPSPMSSTGQWSGNGRRPAGPSRYHPLPPDAAASWF